MLEVCLFNFWHTFPPSAKEGRKERRKNGGKSRKERRKVVFLECIRKLKSLLRQLDYPFLSEAMPGVVLLERCLKPTWVDLLQTDTMTRDTFSSHLVPMTLWATQADVPFTRKETQGLHSVLLAAKVPVRLSPGTCYLALLWFGPHSF